MDQLNVKINISEAETSQVRALTNCRNTETAIAKLVTLAGRGRLTVRPSKEQYARALRETLADEAAGRFIKFKSWSSAKKYLNRK